MSLISLNSHSQVKLFFPTDSVDIVQSFDQGFRAAE